MKQVIRSWKESLQYLSHQSLSCQIVFYSEDKSSVPFLLPVIDALAKSFSGILYYLTSDISDHILLNTPLHVRAFYIGRGEVRTSVLNNMRADVVVMTVPDLDSFNIRIKRSRKVRHYSYLHHSAVSTHMIYRKGAFDHFDSILCVGPHQKHEIREWERLQGLPAKELYEQGYPPLDILIEQGRMTKQIRVGKRDNLNILLAPSWGPHGLIETCGEKIIRILLDAGHYVQVRPHPETRRNSGKVLDAIASMFSVNSYFNMNEDTTSYKALLESNVMVSDWSGVAMEFSFGLGRPVLFIDVPRKVNNPDYTNLTTEPIEVSYREDVGKIICMDELNKLPAIVAELQAGASKNVSKISDLRCRYFYNVGKSAERGAKIIAELASRENQKCSTDGGTID